MQFIREMMQNCTQTRTKMPKIKAGAHKISKKALCDSIAPQHESQFDFVAWPMVTAPRERSNHEGGPA
ncbi:MAG: hypothetical protein O9293_01255 [Porphyrobacter sp.]|nr:hypothetical protein [Porphyrobacter sp.]